MIELINITKKFSTDTVETTALKNIDLTTDSGQFICVMGPSGGGKSTLLNTLGLLEFPNSGEYKLDGKSVDIKNKKLRTQLRKELFGYIFQNFNLIQELSVFDNVALPLIYRSFSKSEIEKRVSKALSKVSLTNRAKHFPSELSGGQQQRVAVARAIVTDPKYIFADEPTGNLDSKNSKDVLDLLVELNELGTTVVMVTHSESDATYGTDVVRMSDGGLKQLKQEAPLKEFQYA